MSTRRKGKMAQLPYALRTRVNVMLRDGCTYAKVAAFCASEGHPEINEKNVEYWSKPDETGSCGFQDWMREQERLQDIAARREFALEVVKANPGSDLNEASIQLAASHLYELATEFDVENFKRRLTDDPTLYCNVVDMMTKLSRSSLAFAQFRERVAAAQRAIAAECKRAASEGISPETLSRIEQELKLL
mgnify:CR=1 FL=1